MAHPAPPRRVLALALALLCSTSTTSTAGPAEDLRAFVGGRQARLAVVDRAAGGKILLLDTARGGSPTVLVDALNCDAPLLAPDGKQLVYNSGGAVHVRALAGGAPRKVAAGSNGHWYIDAAGEAWIVYTTNLKPVKVTWPDGKGIETKRVRLRDGKVEPVASWKATGGVSPDGRFGVGGYASLVLLDLAAGSKRLLLGGAQGCNPSFAPDDSHHVLYLEHLHVGFSVRTADDGALWRLKTPAGVSDLQYPEWSNDGDFASYTLSEPSKHYSVHVVQLSSKLTTRLLDVSPGSHDWAWPSLWIEGADRRVKIAGDPVSDAGVPSEGGVGGTGGEGETDGCAAGGRPAGWPIVALGLFVVWRRFY